MGPVGWQTDAPLVNEDREKAWVASSYLRRARTVAWAYQPESCKEGPERRQSLGSEGPYVGIDVAKDRLDIAIRPTGDLWSMAHDAPGIAKIVHQLAQLHPMLVVLEATGGLQMPVAGALVTAGLPLAMVNPRQVRDFARATGRLAKTDRLDAQVLAHFAEAVQPTPLLCQMSRLRT
jgi:hypothetical protein